MDGPDGMRGAGAGRELHQEEATATEIEGIPRSYTVFNSIGELLAPATLNHLTGRPVHRVRRLPFSSVDGRSGGHLETVEVKGPGGQSSRSYVLKHISWEQDLTMRLTGDRQGRAVRVWEEGLLVRLPPQITPGVVGCAREGQGWAILLEDFRGHMLPPHEQRLTEKENATVLGAMAAMHETFWREPRTAMSTYSLCSLRARYEALFPPPVEREKSSRLPIVPYLLEGWDLLLELVDPDVAELIQRLHADVGPLCAAMERYPQTLLHGDWHHGNLGIVSGPAPRVVLLDWTFISIGPPAVDLAEYILIGVWRLPSSKEATIEEYRRLLTVRLDGRRDASGSCVEESWWVPQLELALLGEFLRLGFDKAQTAVNGPSEAIRDRERNEIAWWCEHARRATQWL